jgi:3-isopropylmalate/(R)-2-methylmalate dehydratase large subunit
LGMTVAEKILSAHSGETDVSPDDYVTAKIDFARIRGLSRHQDLLIKAGLENGLRKLWDPVRVLSAPGDNVTCLNAVNLAARYRRDVELARKYGVANFYDVSEGIAHQIMVERGHVHPGELIVGDDSHTLIYGALNCASAAISDLEMTYVLTTGELWFRVPETLRIELRGELQSQVMPKDVFLRVAKEHGPDAALGKSIEWVGDTHSISIDGRLCIACSSAELSARFSMFEADEKAVAYVKARSSAPFTPVQSDADASFEEKYCVDLDDIEPYVALPHGFEVVEPVSEVEGIRIDKARVGACSDGRVEDLAAVARILKGRRVHPDVVFYVSPASRMVLREAIDKGIITSLLDSGVVVGPPGCCVCTSHLLVTAPGEVDVSATTRNFIGRHGSTEAQIYLASAATVAASALKGEIADPRKVVA